MSSLVRTGLEKSGLGIIGLGKLGKAIVAGINAARQEGKFDETIGVSGRTLQSIQSFQTKYTIPASTIALAQSGAPLLVCTKPAVTPDLLRTVAPYISKNQPVICVAAATTYQDVAYYLGSGHSAVAAAIGIPARIKASATFLSAHPDVPESVRDRAETACRSFSSEIFWLEPEESIHLATATACLPAYMAALIESLAAILKRPGDNLDEKERDVTISLAYAIQQIEEGNRLTPHFNLSPSSVSRLSQLDNYLTALIENITDSLQDSGIKDRQRAEKMVLTVLSGTFQLMLKTNICAQKLQQLVITPGGITEYGLRELNSGQFIGDVMKISMSKCAEAANTLHLHPVAPLPLAGSFFNSCTNLSAVCQEKNYRAPRQAL